MGALTVQQMADRVAALLEERLGIPGRDLDEKMRRATGKLPSRIRTAAIDLAEAAAIGHNPKLFRQLNQGAIARRYDICLAYFGGLLKWDRRRAFLKRWFVSLLAALTVLAAIVVLIADWRGYL